VGLPPHHGGPSYRVRPSGEIVLNLISEPGHSAVVPRALAGYNVSRDVAVIALSSSVNHRFVNHVLQSPDVIAWLTTRLQGSVTQKINLATLREVPIPLPPRSEQNAIAAAIGGLEEKIESNDRVAVLEDELVGTCYNLVPLANGSTKPLCKVARVVLGGTPSRGESRYWVGGTVPWINSGKANEFRVAEPSEWITAEALERSAAKLMPRGTTLVATTGATLGQVSRLEIESAGNQSLVGVWSDELAVNDWVYLWIRTHMKELTAHATGGAQQHINKGVVEEMEVRVPDPPELRAWHAVVRPQLEHIAALIGENVLLRRLRDYLLPRLISGEIRVREALELADSGGDPA